METAAEAPINTEPVVLPNGLVVHPVLGLRQADLAPLLYNSKKMQQIYKILLLSAITGWILPIAPAIYGRLTDSALSVDNGELLVWYLYEDLNKPNRGLIFIAGLINSFWSFIWLLFWTIICFLFYWTIIVIFIWWYLLIGVYYSLRYSYYSLSCNTYLFND